MCFAPEVSFLVFLIEIILAAIVLVKKPRGKIGTVYLMAALLLFLLGMYQFTEFMFCVSGNIALWGLIGFIIYTFLPVIGIHFTCILTEKKEFIRGIFLLYIIPVLFSTFAIFSENFISGGACSTIFIRVDRSLGDILFLIYTFYYSIFVILIGILFKMTISEQKSLINKRIYSIGLIGVLSFTIPTLVLILIFPYLKIVFPSMMCEFALLFAVSIFFMIHIIDKKA